MSNGPEEISGYTYGMPGVGKSTVSVEDLARIKISAGFTAEDEHYLRLAGRVLADQTQQIVRHWRNGIIASIPSLARHSQTPEGEANSVYLDKSNARCSQWILDTCLRPYDQVWIDYQREIALRHTKFKKNEVDGVRSSAYVPLRDVMAFVAVMNQTIKAYLGSKGNSADEIEKMHSAWCKAIQLKMTFWIGPYTDTRRTPEEW